jgi:hypothetical protein
MSAAAAPATVHTGHGGLTSAHGAGTTTVAALTATANPMSAVLRQAMYRDHWVLQCDTEEELLLWVCTMRELCPSCFTRTL